MIIIVSKITSIFQRHHTVVTLGQQLPNLNKLQDFYLSTPEGAKIKETLKILSNWIPGLHKDICEHERMSAQH